MILKQLELKNFRNYEKLQILFQDNINIIYGPNGSGKTNILESIYVLSFTKSHRSFLDNSLIKDDNESASIKGMIVTNIPINLEIHLQKTKKKIIVDNNPVKKVGTYIEKMNIISFYSDDLNLIKGNPSYRRKYLNLELSQVSGIYYNTLTDYNKLVKIRNEYLKNNSNFDNNYFNILTNYIVEKSVYIYQMRKKYIEKINKEIGEIYKNITNKDNFYIKYITSVELNSKDEIRESLKKVFQENISKEIQYKTTIYGPHRDDFEFYIGENNLQKYGSQGQQRAAILSLKLSEIKLLKEYKKDNPIILLDDVFSELDIKTKNNLLDFISNDAQVIITTTDLENIDNKIKEKSNLIDIVKLKEEVLK